jgi:uncharacterized secreted repeat protein (TIGR03808 family)
MIDRRSFLYAGGLTATAAAPFAMAAQATASQNPRNVADFGAEPNSDRDQTAALQKAIDELTKAGQPVLLPGGAFRIGPLKLPKNCAMMGIPGLTVLRANTPGKLLSGADLDMFHLSGIAFEGIQSKAPATFVSVADAAVSIGHCRFSGATIFSIELDNCSGAIAGVEIAETAATAIVARKASGFAVTGCRITSSSSGGIAISGAAGDVKGFTIGQNHLEGCANGIVADGTGIVSGNIVSGSTLFGLKLGSAKSQGHILAQGNLIRDCRVGIGVSSSGDDIMVSLNRIAGAKDGAIRAFDGDRLVGPDLTRQSAEAYLNLMVAGNVAR